MNVYKISKFHSGKFGIRYFGSLTGAMRENALKNKEFTLFQATDNENQPISYGQFWKLVDQTSNLLKDEFKISKGQRILAKCQKRRSNMAIYLACLQIGAIYVPVGSEFTQEETEYFLKDSEPKLIVCDSGKESQLNSLCAGSTEKSDVISESELIDKARKSTGNNASFEQLGVFGSDVAIICYTSGTTGKPKGACITHENLLSNALTLVDQWKFTSNDKLWHILPLNHIHGLCVSVNTVMLSGASFYWSPKFSPSFGAELFKSAKCNVLMSVPTIYKRLLDYRGFNSDCVKYARLFVSGSGPLSEKSFNEFYERTGMKILERLACGDIFRYGMTEGQIISSNPYDENKRKPGSVGFALPGVQLRVDSENNGMIEYRGANVFLEYWRRPEKTADEFTEDGWFKSGDLGYFDEQGYLHISGRNSDMIISGGLNVYPKEIESVLETHEIVKDACVFPVAHDDFGQVPICVFESRENMHIDTTFDAELRKFCKGKLAAYKVPKKFFLVDSLPRNHMSKVQKGVLKEKYGNIFVT